MISYQIALKLRRLMDKDKPEFQQILRKFTKEEQLQIINSWAFEARPNQLRPEQDFKVILWMCGRGFGKTRALCEDLIANAMATPGKRIAIVGRTSADVRDILIHGESGLLACCKQRGIVVSHEPSKRLITFPNGSIAQSFTAEQPDGLRGVQFNDAYCDELAAWQYDQETFDMLQMTLRLGEDNKIFIATTPRPTKLVKDLQKKTYVLVIRGSTFDNKANLSESFIEIMKEEYDGTRIGRQELYGELLLDTPGALWTWEMIQRSEVSDDIGRVVVAIDPAASAKKDSDETGIIVAGKKPDGTYHVLEDLSGIYTPKEWATVAINAYDRHSANQVVIEVNQGGDMAIETLRIVRQTLPIKAIRATKGKWVRAEPIAALYEKGLVYHTKNFEKLEDQLTSYNPHLFAGSPDRLDALVYALQELKGTGAFGFSFS